MRKPLASLLAAGAVAFVVASALAGAARAEVTGVKLTLSPYAGVTLWDQTVKLEERPIYGGRLGLQFGRRIGLEGTYGIAPTVATGAPFTGDITAHHVGGDLVLDLTKPYAVVPYLFGGYSRLLLDADKDIASAGKKQSFDGWEAGAGVRAEITDRVRMRVEMRDVIQELDRPLGSGWTHHFIPTVGLEFVLAGKVKDTDGDGVVDRKDRCADTPLGAMVDAGGCPTDADGDGVWDGHDQCANTPKGIQVDAKGCPVDSDGDGVNDALDRCASTPRGARVDARGCPTDADADGVWDGLDQCANTPTGATVDATGCPTDADGDGVYDGLDRCPYTAQGLRVDASGCPIEVSEKETQLLDTGMIRLSNIEFDTGKADIKSESHPVLLEVGTILVQWPQLQIEIGGHTDSRGTDKLNQELSEKRAQAVLDYLQSKFPHLQAGQYTAKGYGEAVPIADNKTELGRAKNRRVEFKVLNREVLKKEVERRKLLKKEGH